MDAKTTAILRLYRINDEWKYCCGTNDGTRFRKYLLEIVNDIFNGYITYYAFETVMCDFSKEIDQAGYKIEEFLSFVKYNIADKYAKIEIAPQ